ncbi:MAG: efflux RND transporter periplasmic adaptor subunit [Elusimicrobia bacterium]|nr:efflux RND transporter periplasmic adaptor subunit [Elusimicrobiota bacterium]
MLPASRAHRKKFRRWLAGVGALAGAAMVGLFWWGRRDPPSVPPSAGPPTNRVHVLEMKRDLFEDSLEVVGTIVASSAVDLQFESEGVVAQFDFSNGDRVLKGDVIARLDQGDALLDLREAQNDLRRAEKLFSVGGMTPDDLERARIKVRKAERGMEKRVITAIASGVIADREIAVGQFVTPNRVIARLLAVENVTVTGWVTEQAIDAVAIGQGVVARVATYGNVSFRGKIDKIDPEAQNHQFRVEARLQNPGGLLLPGLMARVKIVTFSSPNALTVPMEALQPGRGGERRVLLAGPDNRVVARAVQAGYLSTQFAVIERGLEPGDRVITQHAGDLAPGDPITIIDQD